MQFFQVPNIDPNMYTGPIRLVGPVLKSGIVTYDEFFGVYAKAIYIGQAGALSYQEWDGSIRNLPYLVPGVWHPFGAVKVFSEGTTIPADQIAWGI